MNGPGRDDGGLATTGLSRTVEPRLLREAERERVPVEAKDAKQPPRTYPPRVRLESKSGFCGGGVEGWGDGVDCSAEYRFRPAVRDSSVTEKDRSRVLLSDCGTFF